jgi:hypothetical protein
LLGTFLPRLLVSLLGDLGPGTSRFLGLCCGVRGIGALCGHEFYFASGLEREDGRKDDDKDDETKE